MSTLCTLNNLVNAYAALMRANKPETVSIVLILSAARICIRTCMNTTTGQVLRLD